jgi:hypothetical protein
MTSAALATAWRRYRGWARRARTIRKGLDRWRAWSLGLTVAGAGLGTLASQAPLIQGLLPGHDLGPLARILSGASAVAMALASYLARTMLDPASERQWIRARSLAEGCKSEAYRFACRVPPYDAADAEQKLLDKVQQLVAAGEDVPTLEVTDEDAGRDLPGYPLLVAAYDQNRLQEQMAWYRKSAGENERHAARCSGLVQLLGALAAGLGQQARSGAAVRSRPGWRHSGR